MLGSFQVVAVIVALSPSTFFAEFCWLGTGKSGVPFGHNSSICLFLLLED